MIEKAFWPPKRSKSLCCIMPKINAPDFRIMKRSFHLIWTFDKRRFLASGAIVLVSGLFTLANTYFLKKAIGGLAEVASGQYIESFYYLLYAFGSAMGLALVAMYSGHLYELFGFRFRSHIEDKINDHLLKLNMALMEDPKTFDTLVRARYAGGEKVNAVFHNSVKLISELLNLCIFSAFMISVSPWVLFLFLIVNVPMVLTRMHFSRKMIELEQEQTPLKRRSEYLSGLSVDQNVQKEIKTFLTGNYFLDIYKNIRLQLFSQTFQLNRQRRKVELIGSLFRNIGWFSAVGMMLWLVTNNRIRFTDLAYLFTLLPQIFRMTFQMTMSIHSLYSNTLYARHVFDLLELQPQIRQAHNPIPISQIKDHTIQFHQVRFRYPGQEKVVLKGINLQLVPGKIVAIVGLNGSGKTTVIKLLSQLYLPQSGSITMGGIDIRQLDATEYLGQFSIIFQDFARYHFSVADNIRLGDISRNGEMTNIIQAGVESGADDFIRSLPNQYETITGRRFDEGTDLSGGQWQKIAIARALYRPSKYIVMDEPTSALDAAAEKAFFESFKDTIGDRGALLISHKLSAVKYADYVYVLEQGQIIEEGTHEELIRKEGQYAWLFDAQSSAYTTNI